MADVARNLGETQFRMWHRKPKRESRTTNSFSPQNRGRNPRTEVCNREQTFKRPAYLRLDSTGENSVGSSVSEDSSTGFCPFEASPSSGQKSHNVSTYPPRNAAVHQQRTAEIGRGLYDRARAAFVVPHLSSRQSYSQNFVRQDQDNRGADMQIVNLDLVAQKFSNMSCQMMNGSGHGNASQRWGPCAAPSRSTGQGDRTFAPTPERNPPQSQFFHPYCGRNQPKFIPSTQNYRRTFYQPWQQVMGRSQPFQQHVHQGFDNFNQPSRWQAPPFPWQPLFNPHVMMQLHSNRGPVNRQQQHRPPHPHRNQKQRTNNHHGNRSNGPQKCRSETSDDAKDNSHGDAESTLLTSCKQSRRDGTLPNQSANVDTPSLHISSANASSNPVSRDNRDGANCSSTSSENNEQNLVSNVADMPKKCPVVEIVPSQTNAIQLDDASIKPFKRHDSIDIILSDYELQSSCKVENLSTDSDFSDVDCETTTDENSDLWESFSISDDPYNPLRGWCCTATAMSASSQSPSNRGPMLDNHVDSGTDDGDVVSDPEEDDDSDDGADEDDLDLPDYDTSSLQQSSTLKLAMPQLTELRSNLSSTPKQNGGGMSPIHPSVAFILGSNSSSSDDDDSDDEDWDTLDESSCPSNDHLWNSFNKVRDPFSPMEAWKCRGSSLASTQRLLQESPNSNSPSVSSAGTSNSNSATLECANEQKRVPSDERDGSDKHFNDSHEPLKPMDGETFAIPTVHFYSARDDMDCSYGKPEVEGVTLKRVASASCLRKVHLTPDLRALKKVRFCADSSFIVLVEKEPQPTANDDCSAPEETDWLACARDRMRFHARIDQTALVLDPVLTQVHRQRAYHTRFGVAPKVER